MFARNLMAAILVAVMGSMTVACLTSTESNVSVAQTQLPLEMSSRVQATQNVVTELATKVNMAVVKVNLITAI